ncbi:MFS transporter [Nocardia sp. NRRL S-836]|uniref:MFS transporter n=1 Tax=Nocardia sp. NRRL S-836 TaxID=1519492 RepID=UPI0006AF15B9|nr:MFS transporter [Nocardia sp. NRRL S-836]KOV80555.1 MFS transporter [Nocardia sp. NRRL S-836]
MSHSARLSDYRAALTTPGMRGPVVASLLARLPIAMVGLSLLLYVERATGSFAAAGLVSAAALVGVAMGSVVQGRLMDRFGPTRPLAAVTALFTLFVTASVIAVEAGAPVFTLVPLALGVGATEPMVGSASRALWERMLPSGPTRMAAYAYESISMEVFFILGPGLAGLLLAAPWAGTGVVVGAVLMVIGALWFAFNPVVRAWGAVAATPRPLLGAFAYPGMRTVALAALGFGVTIGFVEVAVPAFAKAEGHASMGGLMLSLWSISSVIFGVLYGMRPWPRPMHLRLPVLLGGFGLLSLLLAIPATLVGLGIALFVVGTLITPQSTAHSAAIEQVTPNGMAAEAFGWVITSVTVGLALGQGLSGQLIEHFGTRPAFFAAGVAGLVIALAVWLLRATVRRGVPAGESLPARSEMELAAR